MDLGGFVRNTRQIVAYVIEAKKSFSALIRKIPVEWLKIQSYLMLGNHMLLLLSEGNHSMGSEKKQEKPII